MSKTETQTKTTGKEAKDPIVEKVTAIIVDKLSVEEEKVKADASFVNDLGADSLDIVEFVMEVEKEFNITIPDEEATQLTTVGAAIDYIKNHIAK